MIVRAPSGFIGPCLPSKADRPPSGPLWVHEIKHDGYRLQIHKHGKTVRLFTMTGVDWTARYPWIVEGAAGLNADAAVIDAECCVAGHDGVTRFDGCTTGPGMPQPLRMRST
jgi:bifunctional non-homologous end joining protein LigD